MAKNDESTPTARLIAAAQLLKALGDASPHATVIPGGNTPKLTSDIMEAQKVGLFRLRRELSEFLAEPETQADLEALAEQVRDANEKRAAAAETVAAAAPKRPEVGPLRRFLGTADAGHDVPQQARR